MLQPLDLAAWIAEHRDRLRPPVANAQLWSERAGDFIVMVVGGPNDRDDFHIDPHEELFFQVEGDMELDIFEDDRRQTLTISEGALFLLPARVPHRPRRFADTVGVVVERIRDGSQSDALRWYCDECDALMHEAAFVLTDITTQIRDAIAAYAEDADARLCGRCGHRA